MPCQPCLGQARGIPALRRHPSGPPLALCIPCVRLLSVWIVKLVKKNVNSNLGRMRYLFRWGSPYSRYRDYPSNWYTQIPHFRKDAQSGIFNKRNMPSLPPPARERGRPTAVRQRARVFPQVLPDLRVLFPRGGIQPCPDLKTPAPALGSGIIP